ncbi:hypothetical protein ACINKY_23745 [Paenibacillus illinoisensis]|uniref:Uncharacterized protein n=1 Tax=Paenibacillus illinoisensis TaxID=59845 RepID=A0ABW8I0J6_9BACL
MRRRWNGADQEDIAVRRSNGLMCRIKQRLHMGAELGGYHDSIHKRFQDPLYAESMR